MTMCQSPPESHAPDSGNADHFELSPVDRLVERIGRLEAAVTALVEASRPTPSERLFRVQDVAERWSVSPRTVESLASSGDLVSTYVGGSRRFTPAAVDAFERRNARSRPKRKAPPRPSRSPESRALDSAAHASAAGTADQHPSLAEGSLNSPNSNVAE